MISPPVVATVARSLPPVAVRASNLALADLSLDSRPPPLPRECGDVSQFVAPVVELEHDRVSLSAVDAGMLPQMRKPPFTPLSDQAIPIDLYTT